MTITIGIDASLTNTGIVILDNFKNTGYMQASTVIKTGTLRGPKRLQEIWAQAYKFLEGLPFANLALIEDYNYRGQNLTSLAEGQGVLKLLCAVKNIEVITVSPASLKKFATGNSQATKKQMMKHLKESNEHIADARGLAVIGHHLLGKETMVRHELEVLKQLSKGNQKSQVKPKRTQPVSM